MDSEGGEDPIFIKEAQYDKYLNLPNEDRDVQKYSEIMVEMFYNQDYEYDMEQEDQKEMLEMFGGLKEKMKKDDKSKGNKNGK